MQEDRFAKFGKMERNPLIVSCENETKQRGDVLACWACAEPSVWTKRMLTAPGKGVKGDVWFSLHVRWPNRYFVGFGLVNLTQAHILAVKSSMR